MQGARVLEEARGYKSITMRRVVIMKIAAVNGRDSERKKLRTRTWIEVVMCEIKDMLETFRRVWAIHNSVVKRQVLMIIMESV